MVGPLLVRGGAQSMVTFLPGAAVFDAGCAIRVSMVNFFASMMGKGAARSVALRSGSPTESGPQLCEKLFHPGTRKPGANISSIRAWSSREGLA